MMRQACLWLREYRTSERLHPHNSSLGIMFSNVSHKTPSTPAAQQIRYVPATVSRWTKGVFKINAWCNCVVAESKRRKLIFAISEIPPGGHTGSFNYSYKVSTPQSLASGSV